MHATVLDPRPRRESLLIVLAGLLSVAVHAVVAAEVARIDVPVPHKPTWVQMEVRTVQPPAPKAAEPKPEPKPEPEPKPRPKPKPEVVKYKDTTKKPAPKPQPQQPRRLVRPIQGLSASSFVKEGTGDFQARAGNTTATKATSEVVSPDQAGDFQTVPYTSVTSAPRIKAKPQLHVPQAIIDGRIEGRVDVELTIGADGSVIAAKVVKHLHPAADAACVADLKKTRWHPGTRDGQPVIVTGVPYSCLYKRALD